MFDRTLRQVASKYPRDLGVILIHFPLTIHRFSQSAARASECAFAVGRFSQFVESVYDKQDSRGLKSWASFARDAGVRDTSRFRDCASSDRGARAVELGIGVGKQLGVRATPTVIVNGWRLAAAPNDTELVRAIERVKLGQKPF